jgi:hypothetical protein
MPVSLSKTRSRANRRPDPPRPRAAPEGEIPPGIARIAVLLLHSRAARRVAGRRGRVAPGSGIRGVARCRRKIARLDADTERALHELGRHLANLRIDGGFAEITDLIEKAGTMRSALRDLEAELDHTQRLAEDYRVFRRELQETRRQSRALYARLEREIGEIGRRSLEYYRRLEDPGRFRACFEEVLNAPGAAEAPESEAKGGWPARLQSLRRALEGRAAQRRRKDERESVFPRLGWRLLKTDFDQHVDGPLRALYESVRKNVVDLLELERHQKHREEGIEAFDREMREEWGHPDLESMRRDLERQRQEMQTGLDALYLHIGEMFNKHRLHNYVDDSFVAACRQRIKRFHVRTNAWKLKKKEILIALRGQGAAGAPEEDNDA